MQAVESIYHQPVKEERSNHPLHGAVRDRTSFFFFLGERHSYPTLALCLSKTTYRITREPYPRVSPDDVRSYLHRHAIGCTPYLDDWSTCPSETAPSIPGADFIVENRRLHVTRSKKLDVLPDVPRICANVLSSARSSKARPLRPALRRYGLPAQSAPWLSA
jgi:hypothetical protein